MIWLGIALAMFAVAFVGIAWARRRAHREVLVVVPTDLAPRIATATRAFIVADPWQPASDASAPEAAAAIEAALIAGDRKRALELAESSLAAASTASSTAASSNAAPSIAANTTSSNAALWLAWALVANAQPAAALAQLAHAEPRADDPRADNPRADDPRAEKPRAEEPRADKLPLATYLRARAEHLAFEHRAGATGAVPALITTADLAVVTLASGRGAATWLKGTSDVELSAAQARAAIGEHRDVTARCLGRALDALEAAPGFADAAYLVARLAVKAGLLAEARALFDALAPRMTGRPDAEAFDRDCKDLADPAGAVAAAKTPPPPSPAAKRSRSLKVLS